jgi:hypothetical protein
MNDDLYHRLMILLQSGAVITGMGKNGSYVTISSNFDEGYEEQARIFLQEVSEENIEQAIARIMPEPPGMKVDTFDPKEFYKLPVDQQKTMALQIVEHMLVDARKIDAMRHNGLRGGLTLKGLLADIQKQIMEWK